MASEGGGTKKHPHNLIITQTLLLGQQVSRTVEAALQEFLAS